MLSSNKVYITQLSLTRKSSGVIIEHSGIDYCLENSINFGKEIIRDEFYEIFDKFPESEYEIENFIKNNTEDFSFTICVISGNRKIFNTVDELLKYFKDNINKINNENLYDFLLSLVEFDMLFLDYNGNIFNNDIMVQIPLDEGGCIYEIKFSKELCERGKYKFSYNYIGIDTINHCKYIKDIRKEEF